MKMRMTWRFAMLLVLPLVIVLEPADWRWATAGVASGAMVLDAACAWVAFFSARRTSTPPPPIQPPAREDSTSQVPLPPSVKERAREVRKRLGTDRIVE